MNPEPQPVSARGDRVGGRLVSFATDSLSHIQLVSKGTRD